MVAASSKPVIKIKLPDLYARGRRSMMQRPRRTREEDPIPPKRWSNIPPKHYTDRRAISIGKGSVYKLNSFTLIQRQCTTSVVTSRHFWYGSDPAPRCSHIKQNRQNTTWESASGRGGGGGGGGGSETLPSMEENLNRTKSQCEVVIWLHFLERLQGKWFTVRQFHSFIHSTIGATGLNCFWMTDTDRQQSPTQSEC